MYAEIGMLPSTQKSRSLHKTTKWRALKYIAIWVGLSHGRLKSPLNVVYFFKKPILEIIHVPKLLILRIWQKIESQINIYEDLFLLLDKQLFIC